MKTALFPSRPVKALAVMAAAAMLGACATLGGKPEEVVAKNAQAYWNARIQGDTAKAYALVSPGYRKLHSLDDFKREYAATSAREAEVKKVECGPDRCTVSTRLAVAPPVPASNLSAMAAQKPFTIETYSDSIWLLEDGQWSLYLQP